MIDLNRLGDEIKNNLTNENFLSDKIAGALLISVLTAILTAISLRGD